MILSRRRFWSYAAPAIVLAPNIMRVSTAALESLPISYGVVSDFRHLVINPGPSFSDMVIATLSNGSWQKAIRAHNRLLAHYDALNAEASQPS